MRDIRSTTGSSIREALTDLGGPVRHALADLGVAVNDSLSRIRYLLGIPSAVVFVALLFINTATSVILEVIPGTSGKLAWTGVLAVASVILYRHWNRNFKKELNSATLGQPGTAKLSRRRGAVIMLGLDAGRIDGSVARLLREGHSLEWLAFVGTPQTAELGVVQEIRDKVLPMLGRSIPATRVRTWEYGNSESLSDSERSVQEAIEWMLEEGLSTCEVVVDVTNGRRPMHFGALMAADALDVEVQYLAPVWDHVTNQPVKGQEAFKVVRERCEEHEIGR